MIKQMGTVFTSIKMALDMRVNGKMICSMEKEKKFGQTPRCTKAITMKERSTDTVCISGKMAQDMKEIGMKIELKAQESTNGKMEDAIMANGKTTTCMARAFTPGQMEGDMRVNTKWIKSMASEFTNGLMVEFTKEIGIMVSNMVKENTFSKTVL